MSTQDVRPATGPARRPNHAVERMPATVPIAAGLLVVSAIVVLEHARRLFSATTLAEVSTRAVREWCLGRSDEAFELLIADHRPPRNADDRDPAGGRRAV
jgi:hypothetical protein